MGATSCCVQTNANAVIWEPPPQRSPHKESFDNLNNSFDISTLQDPQCNNENLLPNKQFSEAPLPINSVNSQLIVHYMYSRITNNKHFNYYIKYKY